MGFWDNIGQKIDRAATAVASKTEEIADSASISIKISSAEKQIEDDYRALGKLVYPIYKTDGAVKTPEIDSAIEKLEKDIELLNKFKAEQDRMKKEKEAKKAAKAEAKKENEEKKAEEKKAENKDQEEKND